MPEFGITDDARAFEDAPCGLAVLDGEGVVLRANRAMIYMSGYRADEVVGKMRLVDLLGVAGKMFYFTHVDPLLRMQGAVNEISAELKRKDGARIPVYLNLAQTGAPHGGHAQRTHVSVFLGRDRAAYEEELRLAKRKAEHLSAIVLSSPDAIFSVGPGGAVLTANPSVAELFGIGSGEAIGRGLADVLGQENGWPELEAKVTGALRGEHASLEATYERGGRKVKLVLSLSPIFDEMGTAAAASVVCRDVTGQVRAKEHVTLLMNEVNHRSKNLLAVVQAVARQTARSAASTSEFMDRFAARLSAIAASHDLLVSGEWRGIQLDDLIQAQLAHLGEEVERRLMMSGDPIVLSPRAAEALGLAIHELSTNAVKHGALSGESGKVALSWSMGEGAFTFQWEEFGGPVVVAPTEEGFGSVVLGRMAPQSVGGTGTLLYEPTGLRYILDADLSNILG